MRDLFSQCTHVTYVSVTLMNVNLCSRALTCGDEGGVWARDYGGQVRMALLNNGGRVVLRNVRVLWSQVLNAADG